MARVLCDVVERVERDQVLLSYWLRYLAGNRCSADCISLAAGCKCIGLLSLPALSLRSINLATHKEGSFQRYFGKSGSKKNRPDYYFFLNKMSLALC